MGSHGAAAAAAANNTNNDNPSADYSLSRQGSLYSLTLDEFQTQLGNKPLSTMNLDELLRTVWIAESNCENNGSSAATVQPNHNIRLMPSSGSPPPSLHAQSSNLSLFPHDLCTKTVDQVWREISKKGNKTSNGTPGCGAGERSYEDCQQPTLGEMTLEDFLAQAGVIGEVGGSGSNASANCGGSGLMGIVVEPNAAQQHCQWIQYQAQQFMPSGGHQPGGGGQKVAATKTNLMMDSANLSDAPLSPPSFILETLSDTQAPVPLRKKVASKEVMVERTVERRQKRMIKNRESAARSRARKQAYTNELENKVSRLEEENKRLRRMKEAEKVLPSLPPPEPKCHQLRRTNSGPL